MPHCVSKRVCLCTPTTIHDWRTSSSGPFCADLKISGVRPSQLNCPCPPELSVSKRLTRCRAVDRTASPVRSTSRCLYPRICALSSASLRAVFVMICLFGDPLGRVRSQPNRRRLTSRHFRGINDDSLRATPHLFHGCL